MRTLKTNCPIVFFDLETTGTDISKDRIVQIACVKRNVDGSIQVFERLINPGIPIPPQATEVHGITDEMVKEMGTMKNYAADIYKFICNSDLAGYNILRFDLPMLAEELARAGLDVDLRKREPDGQARQFIDSLTIFYKKNPRDLQACAKTYLGEEKVKEYDFHNAVADAKITLEILDEQIKQHEDIGETVNEINDFCFEGKQMIDFAGRFIRNEKKEIVFSFGKNVGRLASSEKSYLDWMITGGFTADTKRIAKQIRYGQLI